MVSEDFDVRPGFVSKSIRRTMNPTRVLTPYERQERDQRRKVLRAQSESLLGGQNDPVDREHTPEDGEKKTRRYLLPPSHPLLFT